MKKLVLCIVVVVMLVGAVAGCHHEVEPAPNASLSLLDS